jgi:hypothetical protein
VNGSAHACVPPLVVNITRLPVRMNGTIEGRFRKAAAKLFCKFNHVIIAQELEDVPTAY